VSTAVSSVKLTIDGPRATIELCRPPLNVINAALMDEFIDALETVAGSRAKLLVLRGNGRMFSAGADVAEHLPPHHVALLDRLRRLGSALATLEIPSIVYAHGAALGAGLELALVADLVYAAPGTKLGQPEIVLGVMPPLAAACLPSLIGHGGRGKVLGSHQ
jgi:cyclohexa-1,5-dienecarbonyl-CoA hydratase